jgi:ferredoxin
MVGLEINGKRVEAKEGATVLETALENDIHIPTLCYHPKLPKIGACRVCVVEVEKMRTLAASCALPVKEGMVVKTHSPRVMAARKLVVELMLAHHPFDCENCESDGKCELQNLANELGITKENLRFSIIEPKEKIDDSNPLIIRDVNKCILCGRCVSACEELQHRGAIGFVNRGHETTIVPGLDQPLFESECASCGECIHVCPVGALTDVSEFKDVKVEFDEETCIRCGNCVEVCPFDAVRFVDGCPSFDSDICNGCGRCLAVCPSFALTVKNSGHETISSRITEFSSREKRPKFLAFGCQWSKKSFLDKIEPIGGTVEYVELPCSGRTDPLHILRAFREGIDAVLITACPTETCPRKIGKNGRTRMMVLKDILDDKGPVDSIWAQPLEGGWRRLRNVLDQLGLRDRFHICFTSPKFLGKFDEELQRFVHRIAEDMEG